MLKKAAPLAALALLGLALPTTPAQDAKRVKRPQTAISAVRKVFQVDKPVDASIVLTDIDGKKHSLQSYRGKALFIDFWSNECPVSRGYEKRLIKLHQRYSKMGVVFLAIDSNEGEEVPRSILPTISTENSTASASWACVRPRILRYWRTFVPKSWVSFTIRTPERKG